MYLVTSDTRRIPAEARKRSMYRVLVHFKVFMDDRTVDSWAGGVGRRLSGGLL
jgi:hypothetical protein